ncbi:hypothetical protein [Cohnella sp. GCM10012308]|uniref:hypothetical protein n=1 Tax=Cohnella sp. GCM10012308 TaxID=3317329 RepID=UPI003619FBFA
MRDGRACVCGQAAVAVNGAKLYLEPDAQSMAYVSSHNAKFNEKNKALKSSQ